LEPTEDRVTEDRVNKKEGQRVVRPLVTVLHKNDDDPEGETNPGHVEEKTKSRRGGTSRKWQSRSREKARPPVLDSVEK
jgi:hypothetical protein